MACVYAIRLPLRVGVTCAEALKGISGWLNDNACLSLRDLSFGDLSTPMEITVPGVKLWAASAMLGENAFTAVRIQTDGALSPALPALDNMGYRLDLLLEERLDGRYFTLQFHCSPQDPRKPAQLPRIEPPEMLRQLAEQGLLEADCGLPLQQMPLKWTPALDNTLRLLQNGSLLPALPLLFVREGNYALTPKLAARLSQFSHVLLLPAIHPALSGLGAGGIRVHFPRLGMSFATDLSAPAAGESLAQELLRLTALSLPGDLPDLAEVLAHSNRQAQPSAGHLCMNRKMAEAIRFYRVKSGLTQAELGKITDTTGLLISRLENGRPARVKESLIAAIEEALGLTNGEIRGCEGLSDSPVTAVIRPAFCPVCGTKTAENGNFCQGCGIRLT